MGRKFFTVLVFSSFAVYGFAQTNVPLVISASETWTEASSPYYISGNTIVQDGAVLTVSPGVRVISTGDFKLMVNGALRAMGNKDSIVSFESMTIEFGTTAIKYNNSTGAGSRFDYVRFSSFSQSGYNVRTTGIDLGFDHCLFSFGYYCIYALSSKPINIWVTHSTFKFKNGGYPVYGMYESSYQYLVGNYFDKPSYLYLGETNIIKNNYVYGGPSTSVALYWQYYTLELDASCNNFRNCQYGLYLGSTNNNVRKSSVKNNNFDSCRYTFFLGCTNVKYDSIEVVNNNILNPITYAISFSGTCGGSGSFKSVQFQNNFWNTSDTAVILNKIYDFRKDALVPWKVNINNFLTSPVAACWPLNPSQSVSVEPLHHTSGFSMYPNPASSSVTLISESEIGTVSICDFRGAEVVRYTNAGNELVMDLSGFSHGVYFLHCADSKGKSYVQKLLIE